jgi:hypothetical protein
MKPTDPTRLSKLGSEVPARLRDALGAARGDLPSAARIARIASRFPAVGAPAGGAAGGGAAPLPSALSGALVGAALGVVVSAVGLLVPTASPPEPRVELPAPVGSPSASLPPRALSERSELPTSPTASPRPMVVASSPPHRSAPPSASEAEPLPEPPPVPAVEAETEVQLLQRAKDALAVNAARALALTEEHAARFPSGMHVQEREVFAIQALLRLGRRDEARARAASLLATFPNSVHRRRIEALVAP